MIYNHCEQINNGHVNQYIKKYQTEINNCMEKNKHNLLSIINTKFFYPLMMQLSKTVLVDSSTVSTNLSIGSCENPYIRPFLEKKAKKINEKK